MVHPVKLHQQRDWAKAGEVLLIVHGGDLYSSNVLPVAVKVL